MANKLRVYTYLRYYLCLYLSAIKQSFLQSSNQAQNRCLSIFVSCDPTLRYKLLKLLNQNPWIKSGPGDFQFGILPRNLLQTFLGYTYDLLFCNTDFTLQVFQPFHIPTMIYRVTPYVSPKFFSIFQHLADYHHISLLPDSVPYKTSSDYSETLCLVDIYLPIFDTY